MKGANGTSMNASLEEAVRIARFLKANIHQFGQGQSGRDDWTGAVQRSFDAYLNKENFGNGSEVLPPIVPEKISSKKDEFLVDFVLWRRDLGDGNKSGAWIACESEWNRNSEEVLKDFDKLLSFRAPYKVMIYGANKKPQLGEECRAGFYHYLSTFYWNTGGEAYIFLEFVDGERIADIYTCLPSIDCTLVLAK
jgi:hypothetical protein